MKKKRLFCAILILALAFAIAGCGSSQAAATPSTASAQETASNDAVPASVESGSQKKDVRVTVLMPNAGDTYLQNKSYGHLLAKRIAI